MIKKPTKIRIIILKKEIIIFNVDILNSFLKNFQGSEKFREKNEPLPLLYEPMHNQGQSLLPACVMKSSFGTSSLFTVMSFGALIPNLTCFLLISETVTTMLSPICTAPR